MNLNQLSQLANSETFFAVLFVTGLVYIALYVRGVLDNNRLENAKREAQLMSIYQQQVDNAIAREEATLARSEAREKELMDHLDNNTEQLKSISNTLKRIDENMDKLDHKVDTNLKEVWKELGGKQNR